MKKKVKIIAGVVIAVAVIVVMGWSYMQPMAVPTVTLAPKEAYAYFIEDGTVTGGTDFMLYPEVSGTVLSVARQKGDYVNAGDVIMRIDKSGYERQLAMHEANISGYRAQIDSAVLAEENAKDGYKASINALTAQLSQIEAQRKSAEAARISATTASEQLELLQIAIDKAKADVALSEDNVRKLEILKQSGAISEAQLKEANNALDASKALLRQYETEYAQADSKAEAGSLAEEGEAELFAAQSQATREQIAELNNNLSKDYSGAQSAYYQALIAAEEEAISGVLEQIEKCEIITPVSGYIIEIPAENLSVITPQSCAAIIKTEGDTQIESYVSSKDLSAVKVGDQVELVLKGRDTDVVLTGDIRSISKWAENKPTALGLDEKMIRVVISTTDSDLLLPGIDLDVKYTIYKEQDKLLVPTSAIFSSGGSDFVFTIKDGKALKTQITKGVKTLTETVVESGVKNGDIVVSEANTEGLREGARVRPE